MLGQAQQTLVGRVMHSSRFKTSVSLATCLEIEPREQSAKHVIQRGESTQA